MYAPPLPPSIGVVYGDGFVAPSAVVTQIPDPQASYASASPPASFSSSSSSKLIVIIVIASAIIVAASVYVILRVLSKRFHRSFRTFAAADDVVLSRDEFGASSDPDCHVAASSLLESLPLFAFRSVTGSTLTGGDCAVCLSKFEPNDQLRLLPLCCHAFHAACIDTWIVSNQSCPLCRSTVLPCEDDVLSKTFSENRGISTSNRNENRDSFRIEIGSVSRRHGSTESPDGRQRSYSMGSFEYIVEDGYVVSVGATTHRRGASDCTSVENASSVGVPIPESHPEVPAGEAAGVGRNWLREYVDRLASVSFRSSGRFFSGSSRRSEIALPAEDLEANRVGEEISELFRWLSGV